MFHKEQSAFFIAKISKEGEKKCDLEMISTKDGLKKESKKMDKKDNTQMAIVFLLTANLALWNRCRIYMIDNKIPIHRVRLNRSTEEGYLLFCAAKDIALGSRHISMNDLVDKDVVSGAMWQLIFTALEIKRFGVGMVIPYPKQVEKKKGGK